MLSLHSLCTCTACSGRLMLIWKETVLLELLCLYVYTLQTHGASVPTYFSIVMFHWYFIIYSFSVLLHVREPHPLCSSSSETTNANNKGMVHLNGAQLYVLVFPSFAHSGEVPHMFCWSKTLYTGKRSCFVPISANCALGCLN